MVDTAEIFLETKARMGNGEGDRSLAAADPRAREGNKIEVHHPHNLRSLKFVFGGPSWPRPCAKSVDWWDAPERRKLCD
jgi:hypothetical protein